MATQRPLVGVIMGSRSDWETMRTDFAMTGSNFQYASRLTELVLCGAVAYRSQGSITYDFESGIIVGTNAKRAMELMTAPSRDDWALDPNSLFFNSNGFKIH